MMRLLPAFAAGILVGCGSASHDAHTGHGHSHAGDPHTGHAGGGAPTLHVSTDPVASVAGKPATLKLMVHGPGGEMVKDFATVHDAKVHLIVVREGLDYFAHLHPEADPDGNLKVSYTFPAGGRYILYADYQPVGKGNQVASTEVTVGGDAPLAPALAPNAPGTVTGDGLAADVSLDRAKAGEEATVRFRLRDQDGRAVTDIEPYMGARGHLVVLSADGKRYVHAHPEGHTGDPGNAVAFSVHFSEPGTYKAFGQFKRGGKVYTVTFVARVV